MLAKTANTHTRTVACSQANGLHFQLCDFGLMTSPLWSHINTIRFTKHLLGLFTECLDFCSPWRSRTDPDRTPVFQKPTGYQEKEVVLGTFLGL